MKTITILFAAFLFAATADAQWYSQSSNNNVMVDINGSPVKLQKKLEVAGSPYFQEEYCEASFYATSGRVYRGVRSRLNLQTNTLTFLNKDNLEYVPAFPVSRIEFAGCGETPAPAVFRSGFPAVGLQNENTFYQVLDSGKTLLLKYTSVVESRNAMNGFTNTATSTVLDRQELFYVYTPGKQMVRVSAKSADDVLKVLEDKRMQLDAYLKSNNLKVKKQDDLVKVVQYYNTL